LKVNDDGKGLLKTKGKNDSEQNHFGLGLIQERATMIHARLEISTVPGEGTTVNLEVPL
jgi:signal transduction histidine kinase